MYFDISVNLIFAARCKAMNPNRYNEVESFLFRQLPMYQRVGAKAFKKDLSNIKALASLLDNPHRKFKSIHIAGTNGKGSTCFFIASALHQLGFKVGLYTSPHYKDYRERIKINGEKISKSFVKQFVKRLVERQVFDQDNRPSFFEVTVAMAFQYFADEDVDYAVIETGLGGRLDSTNIITPIVSTITNIGLDHTNFLGNTLNAIAGEKAGIVKPRVPVIIGRRQKETESVFVKKANKSKSPITFAEDQDYELDKLIPKSIPDFQLENCRTALATIKAILPNSDGAQIKKAWNTKINEWGYLGRYQIVNKRPRIILDSAHNKMGLSQLFTQLSQEKYQALHIVMGVVSDKDLSSVLPFFPKVAHYYFSQAKIPRALDKDILKKKAANYNLTGQSYTSIRTAFAMAKRKANKRDLILVTGSIFTVAEVV